MGASWWVGRGRVREGRWQWARWGGDVTGVDVHGCVPPHSFVEVFASFSSRNPI